MPKISVQIEADSAEEFRSLIASFFIPTTSDAGVPPQAEPDEKEDLARQYETTIGRIKKDIEAGTFGVESVTLEPSQGPSEGTPPPVKPKRGRPAKTAPVEPAEATQPAVTPQPVPPVEEPVSAVVETAAAAKVKTMPHAQPENGAASRQDLLDAFSEYVQRYGASFGFSDISQLLQKNLGDGVRKASDVPEEKLSVAIGAIKTAIADNPFNRKRDYA
jgi:hypothetical protein